MMSVCAGLGVGRMLGRIPELTLGRGDTEEFGSFYAPVKASHLSINSIIAIPH